MAGSASSSTQAPRKRAGRHQPRPGADGILTGALELFHEVGYSGTTVRMIAAKSKVTVAALYHHFPSKQAILVTTMRAVMTEGIERAEAALAECPDDPVERLRALVAMHVRYHLDHTAAAVVAVSELRGLEGRNRAKITALRDRYQQMFTDTIAAGCAAGAFHVADAGIASRAVLSMCGAVSSWYRPGGPLTAADLEQRYCELALNTVGYRPPNNRGTPIRAKSAKIGSAG